MQMKQNIFHALTVFLLAGFLFLAPVSTFALGPAPPAREAQWWQQTWGTVQVTPKIVPSGELIKITAVVHNGGVGEPQWVCTQWGWIASGTGRVTISYPSSFELVDYTIDTGGDVRINPGSGFISFSALEEETPAYGYGYSDTCSCSVSWWGGAGNCTTREIYPETRFEAGTTVTVTLRTAGGNCEWDTIEAEFSGNVGNLGWSNKAVDYLAVSADPDECDLGIHLSASPVDLPASEESTLTATVFDGPDIATGDPMEGQRVNLSVISGMGILSAATGITNAAGQVTARLSTGGFEDRVTVRAEIPFGKTDHKIITFSESITDPVTIDSVLGDGQDVPYVLEPVNAGIGNFVWSKDLFEFPSMVMPLAFRVVYNSRGSDYEGPLGRGWSHSFDIRASENAGRVTIKWEDGRKEMFEDDGSGGFGPVDCQTRNTLAQRTGGGWEVISAQGVRHGFGADGRLERISDRNNNAITLAHETSPVTGQPRLAAVTDTAGRQVTFRYGPGTDRVEGIRTPLKTAGDTVSFAIDPNDDLVSITDARSHSIGISYDGHHRAETVTNARGDVAVRNQYDPATGRLEWQEDAESKRTSFDYAAVSDGTRVTITPPTGEAVIHRYDHGYNIREITDGRSKTARFGYNAAGHRIGQEDKNKNRSHQYVDSSGNPVLIRDNSGALTRVEYDAWGQPLSVTDSTGATTRITRDDRGNWTARTDALGSVESAQRDSKGLMTRYVDRKGNPWHTTYTAMNLIESVTDPQNHRTTYSYDPHGRVTGISYPDGSTEQMEWDENGNLTAYVDPLGNRTEKEYDEDNNEVLERVKPAGSDLQEDWAVTQTQYDALNRITRILDAQGGEQVFAYGGNDMLERYEDADGVVTTFDYDAANQIRRRIDAHGRADTFDRDSNGDVIAYTNRAQKTWTYERDALARVTAVQSPTGARTEINYDAMDRVVRVTDGESRATRYEYDQLGRLTRTGYGDQSQTVRSYDRNGNLVLRTDGQGGLWRNTYDSMDRLIAARDPYARMETFAYDALGRVAARADQEGNTFSYSRDLAGKVTHVFVNEAPDAAMSWTYDGFGYPAAATRASGTVHMTYDKLGRCVARTDQNGKTMGFSYTPAGRAERTTYPGGVWVDYSRDRAGSVTLISDSFGKTTTLYPDSLGRAGRIDFANGARAQRTWDDNGWLETVAHTRSGESTPFYETSFARNHAGQILGRTGTPNNALLGGSYSRRISHGPANEITSIRSGLTTRAQTTDLKGNVIGKSTPGGTAARTFDPFSRMTASERTGIATSNEYDAYGRRVRRTQNGTETNYLRDSRRVHGTYNASGDMETYVVNGDGGLLYSLDSTGNIQAYHGDERGNVVAVTGNTASDFASYAYASFGALLDESGTLSNDFKFQGITGAVTDLDSLVNMVDGTFFDTEDGRFAGPGDLTRAGESSAYELGGGDPVNLGGPAGVGPCQGQNSRIPRFERMQRPLINPMVQDSSGRANGLWAWKAARSYSDNLGLATPTNDLLHGAMAQSHSLPGAVRENHTPVGQLRYAGEGGPPMIQRQGKGDFAPVTPDTIVTVGDIIQTGPNQYANIDFASGGSLAVNQNTTIEVTGIKDAADRTHRSLIENAILQAGETWAKITRQQEEIQFQTHGGVLGIKG